MTVRASPLAVDDLENHRRELTGYFYRMLGSSFEAEDAVQETMVRAWRSADRFEGRSSARSWLYRIATNVCLDQLRAGQRRARPMEMGPAMPPVEASLERMLPEHSWVSPIADARIEPENADPAEIVAGRETVRLAFVAALQHLPAKQRAVLILCEVLRWQASEVAVLLETSVASVNSALQRARATLAEVQGAGEHLRSRAGEDDEDLLRRYVDAFERYDVDALVALLAEDAVQSMPPYAMWIRGAGDIGRWLAGPGAGCRGSRMLPTSANGCPAFGQYRVDPAGGHAPWALQVLEITDGRITGFHSFLDPALFPAFGLPTHLPAGEPAP